MHCFPIAACLTCSNPVRWGSCQFCWSISLQGQQFLYVHKTFHLCLSHNQLPTICCESFLQIMGLLQILRLSVGWWKSSSSDTAPLCLHRPYFVGLGFPPHLFCCDHCTALLPLHPAPSGMCSPATMWCTQHHFITPRPAQMSCQQGMAKHSTKCLPW